MIYPCTITIKYNLPRILETLLSLGYHCHIPLAGFLSMFNNTDLIYVVINDADVFGEVWFYRRYNLDRDIPQDYIADETEFLRKCAELKGETEF